jgi:ankyrin repeat protein
MLQLLSRARDDPAELFRYAAQTGQLNALQALWAQHGSCIVDTANGSGWTALHHSCYHGNLAIFQYLVETCGANVNAVEEEDGDTPLHFASGNGHAMVVQYLVERGGANVHAVNGRGDTALHYACMAAARRCSATIVRYLVECGGANVVAVNAAGRTPLHHALVHGCCCSRETALYLVGFVPVF